MWLFIGVVLILGSGERWQIPVAASLVFTGIVILLPAAYEYLLSDAQKLAVNRTFDALSSKLRPKKSRSFSSGSSSPIYNKDPSDAPLR